MIDRIRDLKFEIRLKEIVGNGKDLQKIFTPLAICREMIDSLPGNLFRKPKIKYLCSFNIEFLYVLKERNGDLGNVWFATDNIEDKGDIAQQIGIKPENILLCKNYTIETEMKFDVVISNPPYNPNNIWAKFVELGMSAMKDDGHLLIIHPATWRESSKFDKLADVLKKGIKELHIKDYGVFEDVTEGLKTDWYLYYKQEQDRAKVIYSDGNIETFDLKQEERIYRISPNSIPYGILKKITSAIDNGLIMTKGFEKFIHDPIKGTNKQCGGEGRGTNWTKGDFTLTKEKTRHQHRAKVVTSYVGKPRATFFSEEESVGVIRGNYWLTTNKHIPTLLNSNMLWKIFIVLMDPESKKQRDFPAWLLRNLNFDNFNATTEQEMYEHFKLTKEEIEWIEQ